MDGRRYSNGRDADMDTKSFGGVAWLAGEVLQAHSPLSNMHILAHRLSLLFSWMQPKAFLWSIACVCRGDRWGEPRV